MTVTLILAALIAGLLGYFVSVGLAVAWLVLVAIVLLIVHSPGGVAP